MHSKSICNTDHPYISVSSTGDNSLCVSQQGCFIQLQTKDVTNQSQLTQSSNHYSGPSGLEYFDQIAAVY